ncbi:alanine racemase [Novosphingobium sp.]|uniref:alanine racemase n=1 Tax=Novosphingobium sp. TaxID=1874826 RepID=UPI0027358E8A|nr:alanine racemase [Novosphingobium sp.]MDP3905676.1 alanine racemase [Novosphingobium sp.]
MTGPDAPASPLRLTIDTAALTANWRALDRRSGAARAGAAVKADGYGVGAAQVAPVLQAAGCSDFFVAHWGEVAALAAHVPAARIAVLHGPLTPADSAYARAAGVRPVINSIQQAQLWRAGGGGVCDLMVDTGINRLGVSLSELDDPVIAGLTVDVLHSHLAAAEEPDNPLNRLQRERWQAARALIPHRRAALANSAGIALGQDYHGDLTRPGLALYGGVPCAALAGHIRQVVRPQAAIMQVRELQPGDSVGYNATFTAAAAMRVGVVSVGYADGYLRCWSDKGVLRSGERALPVLGRVSMDMTVVDLTRAPDLREGDWLEIDYDLPQAAQRSGLSQYELLTLLGRRFAR